MVVSCRAPDYTHQLPGESLNPLLTPPGTHDRDSPGNSSSESRLGKSRRESENKIL
jgi:hypothetical protein